VPYGEAFRCAVLRRFVPFAAALAALAASAQQQVQFIYDPAGNLIQVLRAGKPDLAISGLSVSSISQHSGGGYDIAASFTVTNIGNLGASGTWYDRGYLSTDTILNDSDTQLGGFNTRSVTLAPGASYLASTTFTTSASTPAGTTYFIVKTDGGTAASGQFSPTGANVVDESVETNNGAFVSITLPAQLPDLSVTTASLGSVSVNQNGTYSLPVTYTVTNTGGATANAPWYDLAYLSADSTLDNADTNLSVFALHGSSLAVGSSYTLTTTYTANAATAPGSYTLLFKTDGHGATVGAGTNTDAGGVAESNEANNTFGMPVTLPSRPDLQITSATAGSIIVNQNGSYTIPVTYTVANAGGSAAQPSWYDLGYLSADGTLDNADVSLSGFANHNSALAAGGTYTATANFTTSTTTSAGAYTVFVKADGHASNVGGTNTDNGNLVEVSESNNAASLAVTLPARPDLQISNTSVGTVTHNANGSYSFPITYTVTNIGGAPAQPGWYDIAFISTDATLSTNDVNLGGWSGRSSALAVGASYTNTTTFTTTTTTAAGSYTVFMKTDGHGTTVGTGGTSTDGGNLAESNESNNAAALSVTLP